MTLPDRFNGCRPCLPSGDGIDDACERPGVDLVVGTDAGGDVLAAGHEPGIASPLPDALNRAGYGTELDVERRLAGGE